MGTSVSSWKAISAERAGAAAFGKEKIVEDPGITRLDIDRYQRALKLNLSEAAREETLALLADAELRLQNGATSTARKNQDQ
jgi:hypothetical protein